MVLGGRGFSAVWQQLQTDPVRRHVLRRVEVVKNSGRRHFLGWLVIAYPAPYLFQARESFTVCPITRVGFAWTSRIKVPKGDAVPAIRGAAGSCRPPIF